MTNDGIKEAISWAIHSLAESVKDWDDDILQDLRSGVELNKVCMIDGWKFIKLGELPDPDRHYSLLRLRVKASW